MRGYRINAEDYICPECKKEILQTFKIEEHGADLLIYKRCISCHTIFQMVIRNINKEEK